MIQDDNLPQTKGPFSYENWQAHHTGLPLAVTYEYPLFTDAHLVGNHIVDRFGPYQIINAVAIPEMRQYRPSLILRVENYMNNDLPDMKKTDEDRYHGGGLADEIASIMSLCLGIRLKSGGISRMFEKSGDQKGTPVSSWDYTHDPILPKTNNPPTIPRVIKTHLLDEVDIFSTFLSLSPQNAIALVRSARLYQEAVWIAESTPELSWIMLVSAIETAASRWRDTTETPLERLRASRPKLEDILRERGNDDFISLVAEQIAPYMGATKKFVDFLLEFLPPPPEKRPSEFAQHLWTAKAMKKSMEKIYSYRSRALHGGIPFPAPMCLPPRRFSLEEMEEIPLGYATSMKGAVWVANDIPMLLHIFEYIVQKSLLRWWESMVSQINTNQ